MTGEALMISCLCYSGSEGLNAAAESGYLCDLLSLLRSVQSDIWWMCLAAEPMVQNLHL